MTFWMAIAGAVAITGVVALIERWFGRDETALPTDPVHYGHTNVGDHEYDDPEPHNPPTP